MTEQEIKKKELDEMWLPFTKLLIMEIGIEKGLKIVKQLIDEGYEIKLKKKK
jgi:hypothetical protein